jgi:kynurenine formamidase
MPKQSGPALLQGCLAALDAPAVLDTVYKQSEKTIAMDELLGLDLTQIEVIDLEFPRTANMPEFPTHKPAYAYTLYHRHEDMSGRQGVRSSAFGQLHGTEHAGTHIDAPSHQAESMMMCGGIPVDATTQTPTGFTCNGAEAIPPILARGVLLDVAALKGVESLEPGYAVTDADLVACCERQGVTVTAGDVVLVSLGNARHWPDAARYLHSPGIAASGSRWLAERGVHAVGSDNIAWDLIDEFDRDLNCNLPGHVLLLVRAGIYIMENLNLGPLVASGHAQFLFVALPLKLVGATGSPIRPVALIPRQPH